jgi:hypothetical protein
MPAPHHPGPGHLPGSDAGYLFGLPAIAADGGSVFAAFGSGEEAAGYFAGWKEHYSLYPAGERLVAAFKDELASYDVTQGTIRFPLSRPVPVKLIGRIAKFRAKEIAERQKAKAAASKRR